jgi:hypothetical protein
MRVIALLSARSATHSPQRSHGHLSGRTHRLAARGGRPPSPVCSRVAISPSLDLAGESRRCSSSRSTAGAASLGALERRTSGAGSVLAWWRQPPFRASRCHQPAPGACESSPVSPGGPRRGRAGASWPPMGISSLSTAHRPMRSRRGPTAAGMSPAMRTALRAARREQDSSSQTARSYGRERRAEPMSLACETRDRLLEVARRQRSVEPRPPFCDGASREAAFVLQLATNSPRAPLL